MQAIARSIVFNALCGAMLAVLAACGGNPLLGTWHSDGGQTWIFETDTVRSNIPQLVGQVLKTSYKTTSDSVAVVPANGSALTFHIVDRDTVTYINPADGLITLHRDK